MAKVESKRKSLVKILAAGSSGLIGTALCSRLEREGHEVVRLVRRQPAQGELRWDPEAGELEQEALEGIEAAVHLGGRNIVAGRWTATLSRRNCARAECRRRSYCLRAWRDWPRRRGCWSARRPLAFTVIGATRSWTRKAALATRFACPAIEFLAYNATTLTPYHIQSYTEYWPCCDLGRIV